MFFNGSSKERGSESVTHVNGTTLKIQTSTDAEGTHRFPIIVLRDFQTDGSSRIVFREVHLPKPLTLLQRIHNILAL